MKAVLAAASLTLLATAARAQDIDTPAWARSPSYESDAYIGWTIEPLEKDSEFLFVRGYTHQQKYLRVPYWNRWEIERRWFGGSANIREATDGQVCWWEQRSLDTTYEYLASLRLRLTHDWHLDTLVESYFNIVAQIFPAASHGTAVGAGVLGTVAWQGRVAGSMATTMVTHGTTLIGNVAESIEVFTAEAVAASNATTSVDVLGAAAARTSTMSAGATFALGAGVFIAAFGGTTALVRAFGGAEYRWLGETWIVDDVRFDSAAAPYDTWWTNTYEPDGSMKSPLQWASSGTQRGDTVAWTRISGNFPCGKPIRFSQNQGTEIVETWYDHEGPPAAPAAEGDDGSAADEAEAPAASPSRLEAGAMDALTAAE